MTERFIGLETADLFLQRDGVFFERVIADMNDLPVRPRSFDLVFMTSTLHHSSNPSRTLSQVERALDDGGRAIVINEPIRTLPNWREPFGAIKIEHGINENIYTVLTYLRAARQAGLRPQLLFPQSLAEELKRQNEIGANALSGIGFLAYLWRRKFFRKLARGRLLPALCLLVAMPLVMIAHKPAR